MGHNLYLWPRTMIEFYIDNEMRGNGKSRSPPMWTTCHTGCLFSLSHSFPFRVTLTLALFSYPKSLQLFELSFNKLTCSVLTLSSVRRKSFLLFFFFPCSVFGLFYFLIKQKKKKYLSWNNQLSIFFRMFISWSQG